jgi:hypothetical protein
MTSAWVLDYKCNCSQFKLLRITQICDTYLYDSDIYSSTTVFVGYLRGTWADVSLISAIIFYYYRRLVVRYLENERNESKLTRSISISGEHETRDLNWFGLSRE